MVVSEAVWGVAPVFMQSQVSWLEGVGLGPCWVDAAKVQADPSGDSSKLPNWP